LANAAIKVSAEKELLAAAAQKKGYLIMMLI
jgi:hypothetical protein